MSGGHDPQLGAQSDGQLASLALSGRQDAFGQLIRRHRDPIYRLIRSHIGDADEALDLTQETFVAAYGALARYDPARPMRAWLARIALNKCRDRARRRRIRAWLRAEPLGPAALEIGHDAPGPWEQTRDREALRAAAAALAALPATLKEPLLLQVVEELPQAEIARALGISVKAVETRIRRARQQIERALDECGDRRK